MSSSIILCLKEIFVSVFLIKLNNFFCIETGKKYWLYDLKFGNQDFKGTSLANLNGTASTIVQVLFIQFVSTMTQTNSLYQINILQNNK